MNTNGKTGQSDSVALPRPGWIARAARAGRHWVVFSVVMVAAATLLRLQFLQGLGSNAPYITFYLAVVIAALYGGLRAGLLTIALSVVMARYFWVEPAHIFTIRGSLDGLLLLTFVATATMICIVAEAMHRARARAQAAGERERAAHKQAEQIVREYNALLEQRVQERTEELQLERDKLAAVFETSTIGLLIANAQGGDLTMNPTALGLLDFSSVADMHRRVEEYANEWELRDTEGRQLPFDEWPLPAAIRGHYVHNKEFRFRCLKRDYQWTGLATTSAVKNSAGEVVLIVLTLLDITERKRAETVLRESETKLRKVIDGLGPYMFVGLMTPTGVLIEANAPALAAAGLKPEDVLGKPFEQTYWWAYSEPIQQQLRAAIERAAGGTPSRYDVQLRAAEGVLIWIDFSLYPMRDDTGKIVFLIPSAVVITGRKRTEALISGQKQVMEMIATDASLPEILTALVQVIEAQSPGMMGSILLLDADGVHVHHGAAPSMPAEFIAAVDGQPIGPKAGSCGTAAYRKEAVFVEDIATDPLWENYKALALPLGLRACWSTPIFDTQRNVLGTFAMYFRQPGLPQPEHLQLIDVATQSAAIAISRKRAEQEILTLNAELEHRVSERTSKLEVTLATLRNSEMRYRLLVDGVKDVANIMLDTSGRVISWNHGAEQLKGYTAEEIIGRHFSIFYPPESVAAGKPDAELAQALAHGRAEDEGWRVRKDGSRFWANVILTTLHSDKGEVQGFSKITRDITERKQYELQLLDAKENAERANHAKDSFLATMSHEIRTPLTGLLGMLELLSMTPLEQNQVVTLDAAWDSARGLLRIVNDILDWSKIEEGKLELAPRTISIPQLLNEVINTYSRVASAKSLLLSQHADSRLSAAHIVDPLRLSQVLNNFVSNALKFTEHGTIELRVELLEQVESGECIRFTVKDTGIGIAKDMQQHLFQRYQQESADTARLYGGTGLGLAICRRLTELLDGQIELDSAPGQGSTFSVTLTLPVSAEMATPIPTQSSELRGKKITPLHDGSGDAPLVLAVDDQLINRDLLAQQIMLLGLRAETAENGQVALSMWREGRFALVITDCHMPQMDGYALTRAIRRIEAEERLPRTPIIAWTANALASEGDKCRAAGMDELLVKPAGVQQLKMTLAKWLHIAATDSNQPAALAQGDEGVQATGPIDYAALSDVVPDRSKHNRVLQVFQSHSVDDRAQLLEALAQGDPVNVESIAHRMKGSCRMVGAMTLANICAAIEQAARDGNMAGAQATQNELVAALRQLDIYVAGLQVAKGEQR